MCPLLPPALLVRIGRQWSETVVSLKSHLCQRGSRWGCCSSVSQVQSVSRLTMYSQQAQTHGHRCATDTHVHTGRHILHSHEHKHTSALILLPSGGSGW